MTLLDHALTYAAKGWPVFPCKLTKTPYTEHGFKDAATDPEQIRAWWNRWPNASIGWALPADIVVIDVDVKPDEGKYGDETLEAWEKEHGPLYGTVLSLTGGGGLQYFFTTDKPVKCATDVLPSIDVRTKGGYVVLPPSNHPSGRQYAWEACSEPGEVEMKPLPESLYKIMTAQRPRTSKELPAQIADGSRNDTLFRLACSLRSKGLSEMEILAAISQANQDRCKTPLQDKEVKTIAQSAAKYEPGILPNPTGSGSSVRPTDFTDTGNARIFARENQGIAIYVKTVDWLTWDSQVWVEGKLEAAGLAMQLTDRMMAEALADVKTAGDAMTAATVSEDGDTKKAADKMMVAATAYRKHAKTSRNKPKIAAMLDLACTLLQVKPDKLDADPYILNTPAGMVDLRTRAIRPHDPKAYCTKITCCPPGDKGRQIWLDFLETISSGDEKMINFLQQIAGMACVGKVFEENLVIALGDGKNGKSAFFNALAIVLNDYAGTIAAEVLTTANRSKGAEMATLKGKRLIIAAETEEGARLSASMLKQIASTDKIHAERKYKDPEDFTPSHSTILYTNHAPRVGSTDTGTWRRLVMIPFDAKILPQKEIKNYADVLAREAGPAILEWIIEGAANYISTGHKLVIPEFVRDAIEQYQEQNDWMAEFLEEFCEVGQGRSVKGQPLYKTYYEWATVAHGYARKSDAFKAELEKRGFEWRKTNTGATWFGVSLIPRTVDYNYSRYG